MRVLRTCKHLLGTAFATAMCVACAWPVVWFVARSLPLTEPVEVARRHAQAGGWLVPDGEPLRSYYVSGLDILGGGEVEVIFVLSTKGEPWQSFVVRVRRSSFFADLQIVKSGQRDMPLESATRGAVRLPRPAIARLAGAIHWQRVRAGAWADNPLDARRVSFNDRLLELVQRPRAVPEYAALARRRWSHAWPWLALAFDPRIEPSNGTAERAIRPAAAGRTV